MHIDPFTKDDKIALEELIKPYPFLSLTDSHTHYPKSAGTGLPLLLVKTDLCEAVISMQGAQLLEFKTTDSDPLLWLSPNCQFTPGIALRGGVPICLPWFGVNQQYPHKPKHGFVRNQFWQLGEAHSMNDGNVELEFLFVHIGNELFAYDFSIELRMILGKSAKMELTVNNTDTEGFDFSWALHHYYKIQQLSTTRVIGLTNRTYLDNLQNLSSHLQQQDVDFTQAVDRIYPDIANSIQIEMGVNGVANIDITHHHCPSVVVWNPGEEMAEKINDIGKGQHEHYICVERGAVFKEAWFLDAGTSNSAIIECSHYQ